MPQSLKDIINLCKYNTLIDLVKVLCPIWYKNKIAHSRDVLSNQSLGLID